MGLRTLDSGLFSPYTVVHKFGRNPAVGTSFVPVSLGGIYRTPQSTSATQVRVKAGNTNDSAAGSGARKVTIQGINASGDQVSEELTTNGTSAGTPSTTSFMRIYRAFVSESGTYATQSVGSHSADIVIEDSAGTEDWVTLSTGSGFPEGQSQVAAYTVPNGYSAFISSIFISIENSKPTDVIFFKRGGILETTPPYEGMRAQIQFGGVTDETLYLPKTPVGPYPAGTDLGFLAKVSSGADSSVSINFEIILCDI